MNNNQTEKCSSARGKAQHNEYKNSLRIFFSSEKTWLLLLFLDNDLRFFQGIMTKKCKIDGYR